MVYREYLKKRIGTDKITFCYFIHPSPGGFAEVSHVYIGKVDAANLGGLSGLDEEDEDIRVHVQVFKAHATEMSLSKEKFVLQFPLLQKCITSYCYVTIFSGTMVYLGHSKSTFIKIVLCLSLEL